MKKQVKIPFTKMSGTGNDFIVIDNRSKYFTGHEGQLFSRLCQRRVSIGADGLILVEEGMRAPVRMHYYNADGHKASMCGNGARCVGFFVKNQNWMSENHFTLETDGDLHEVTVKDHDVNLRLPAPSQVQLNVGILEESSWIEGGMINTGVPHYVIFVKDLDSIPVNDVGSRYRNHKKFPGGINVNFVQNLSYDTLKIRTFERGIEQETLSCGTGSVASALLASKHYGFSSPISVLTEGGTLVVAFNTDWSDISLAGAVDIIYEGLFDLPVTYME